MTTAAIVGPGRVGTLLAVAGARAGWRVAAVAGGSERSRARVCELVKGVRPFGDPVDAARSVDVVLLAVPDDAIEQVVTELAVADVLGEGRGVVHLAGSRGLAPLRRAALSGARVAACHPAMTVPTGATDPEALVGVPWAVTAPPADRPWAHGLVADLHGDPHDVPDASRTLYHAALATASNAVGAAVVAARRLLLAAGIDQPAVFLGPLAHASVTNAADRGVVALTGPIVRGDVGTVRAHVEAIASDLPELLPPYVLLARATLDPVRPALAPDVVAALDAVLADPHDRER
jgi:predicted short-subunit dehydrogenase-like oxidoreductase (DUF2520 family)